jgi:glutamine synthetase
MRIKEDGTLASGNGYPWSHSRAILSETSEAKALEEIAKVLKESGIRLEMYHAEAAPGQVRTLNTKQWSTI